MTELAEEFRGWAGMLRRALGGADVSQTREALRQMGGRITLRLHTERGERRALRPDQTLDGKGIAAGTWEDKYYFAHSPGELPLHPVLAAECSAPWRKPYCVLVAGAGFLNIRILLVA
jgi:hypothetical protein